MNWKQAGTILGAEFKLKEERANTRQGYGVAFVIHLRDRPLTCHSRYGGLPLLVTSKKAK